MPKPTQHMTEQFQHTLFVGNVPYESTEDDLRQAFEDRGYTVLFVKVPRDPEVLEWSRGFGFVTLKDQQQAEEALKLTGRTQFEIDGRKLRLQKKGG